VASSSAVATAMSLAVALAVDGRARRHVVGRTALVSVVVLFAGWNVYRSATLTQSAASSHEFSHRQQLLHSHTVAADRQAGSTHRQPDAASNPAVDRLELIRSVREDEFPEYNVTVNTGEVRAVPLWQRRLNQQHPNSRANAALDDIIGPYYFLTELLQVSADFAIRSKTVLYSRFIY